MIEDLQARPIRDVVAEEQRALSEIGIGKGYPPPSADISAGEDSAASISSRGLPHVVKFDLQRDGFDTFYEDYGEYTKLISQKSKAVIPETIPDEERLILGAAAFVNYIVRQNHGRPTHRLQIMDRVQNGNMQLVRSAKKFDPEKNVSFISFLKPLLGNYIRRYEHGADGTVDQGELIRIPMHRQHYYNIRNVIEGLAVRLGIVLEPEELLQFSDFTFTPGQVEEYRAMRKVHVPFDTVFGPGKQRDIASDTPNDPHSILEASLPSYGVTAVLQMLDERSAYVLTARAGLNGLPPQTLHEIGRELGVSREQVRLIERNALGKLRAIPNIIDIINAGVEVEASHQNNDKCDNQPMKPESATETETAGNIYKNDMYQARVAGIEGSLLSILKLPGDERPSERFIVAKVSQLLFYLHKLNGLRMLQSEMASELGVSSVSISQLLNKEGDYKRIFRSNITPDLVCAKLIGDLYDDNNPACQLRDSIHPDLQPLIEGLRSKYGLDREIVEPGIPIDARAKNFVELDQGLKVRIDAALRSNRYWGGTLNILGPPSSGKTSLALHLIQEAQSGGEQAIYVNAADCMRQAREGDNRLWIRNFIERINPQWLNANSDEIDLMGEYSALKLAIGDLADHREHIFLVIDDFNDYPATQIISSVVESVNMDIRTSRHKTPAGLHVALFGQESTDGNSLKGTIETLRLFSMDEIRQLSKAYNQDDMQLENVYEITGGQPLLTQALLHHGLGPEFFNIAQRHLLRIAELIAGQPDAVMELRDAQSGVSTGRWPFKLQQLGVVRLSNPGHPAAKGRLDIVAQWTGSLYEQQLPELVETLLRYKNTGPTS